MRMPVEIIQEIFLQCSFRQCRLPPASTEPRLVLTHICSTWREIALRTPRMWADVLVDFEYPGLGVRGHSAISTWLSRSSPRLISLQVRRLFNTRSMHLFADLIIPNLHRCRQIDLFITEAELRQLLLLPVGIFSDLEVIQLHLMGGYPKLV
ncbi:hypothetical protein BD779DRAFT_331125 [Infundibulicybe gibba]|nr:hypothetical protein BD779DRAFT_331125 [Infundibulicybe gibba]